MGREEVFDCELLYDMMLLSIDIHTLDYLRQRSASCLLSPFRDVFMYMYTLIAFEKFDLFTIQSILNFVTSSLI